MKHLGDITKINGAEIEPVHCITFGSPCQDLSVAGKRAGLEGERSGLFMQVPQIAKEMRLATNGAYPTFLVWENVPGALSSNKGEDFRAALEELAKIKDPSCVIPRPAVNKGKWAKSGYILADGWSIAWRVHDAKFWGVPQKRRRIALVMDIGGDRAPEILFEREGVRRDTPPGGATWERIASHFKSCAGISGGTPAGDMEPIPINMQIATRWNKLGERTGLGIADPGEAAYTIGAAHCHAVCYNIGGYNSAGMLSDNPKAGIYETEQTRTLDLNGGNPACNQGGTVVCMATGIDCRNINETGEIYPTMQSKAQGGWPLNYSHAIRVWEKVRYICRRLTPLECERLQGYPDNYTNIPTYINDKGETIKTTDSPRYKALGNSIALPFWGWMLDRMARYLPENATLGSLFDGIGGFPLLWEEIHGKGTARWASEIEPFCVAVTKHHFGEE